MIFVVPPEGVPQSTGLVLADAIAAQIRDSDHPAILAREPNQAGASVVGMLASAVPRGQVTWLPIDWSIRAPYGTLVSTYRQQVVIASDLWNRGAPEALNLVIGDAAEHIVSMVYAEVGSPSAVAMTHRRPQPDGVRAAEPANVSVPASTMTEAAPTPAETPPAPTASPPPGSMGSETANVDKAPIQLKPPVTPLARISDGTNGQVVHEGAPGSSVEISPSLQAPTELPSLAPATEVAKMSPQPPGPASAPPRQLVPGAAKTVPPPPGGTVPASEDDGLLGSILPEMGTDTRLADDARPVGATATAFAPVRWGQPSFLIKPVIGAPGNGNEALTVALKSALRDRDLTISEDPRQAGFVIQGDVDTGAPVNGRQYIRINWQVNTVTGAEVGKAVQENTVVAGSLDGEWERVAEVVAHAAVRGIQDLFGDADERLRDREQLPEFPDVKLPSVPGRAPPPPGF